jgi:Protein of unknown function (DUF4246)
MTPYMGEARRHVQQMAYYATLGGDGVALSPVQGVFQSDAILTPDLASALLAAIAPLELVPDSQKDWHPGSDEQVLDLVHPSLFPLIYGVTRRLREPMPPGLNSWKQYVGLGDTVPVPSARPGPDRGSETRTFDGLGFTDAAGASLDGVASFTSPAPLTLQRVSARGPDWDLLHGTRHMLSRAHSLGLLSEQYAWLPADVAIAADGTAAFQSYVNNLHPDRHAPLYAALARLLAASVPLLKATLAHSLQPQRNAVSVDMRALCDSESSQSEDEDSDYERPIVNGPTVPERFEPPQPPDVVSRLRGATLQAIVKVAEIVLTPGKPEYPGGSWHVEGTANERIVATIIAYIECDNITESQLAFRTAVDEYFDYEQNDDAGVEAVYGICSDEPEQLVHDAGAVRCAAGRVVCFPNSMQHRVQPFQLADASRPGVRKIAVFFIVDPATRIPSTRTVPPLQLEWWRPLAGLRAKLPREAVEAVEARVEFPLARPAALRHREALMAERSAGVREVNEVVYEHSFSLCEH